MGAWCCSSADGHLLEEKDWRDGMVGSDFFYEVNIGGTWRRVPTTAMRDPLGGPNPTGKAIVWYLRTGDDVKIFCFAPGTLD